MKKLTIILSTILATALVVISFTSCEEQPGVYKPKKKISKIYRQRPSSSERLSEEWKWDKDKVASITYYWSDGEIDTKEEFIYDGDRLVKIKETSGYYAEYSYLKKKIDRIKFYAPDGDLELEFIFQYDGKKVSTITVQEHDDDIDKNIMSMVERGFVGKLISKEGVKIVSKKIATQSKDSFVMNFSYERDNLSSVSLDDESVNFSDYDKHSNIWYNFFPVRVYELNFEIPSFSKNNPGKQFVKDGSRIYYVANYTYTYDGDFPVIIKTDVSYDDEDDDFDYSYTYTIRIEYQ